MPAKRAKPVTAVRKKSDYSSLARWIVGCSDGTKRGLRVLEAHPTRKEADQHLADLWRWPHWRAEAKIYDLHDLEISLFVREKVEPWCLCGHTHTFTSCIALRCKCGGSNPAGEVKP